jgi:hypothetical protein
MRLSLKKFPERLINKLNLPLVMVVLGPVLLLGGLIFRGEALFWGTPALQFYPWRNYVWEILLNGSLPLWNPLNGMGAPLAANYQLALFYPPGWLLYGAAALGGTALMAWAHTLLSAAHLVWAGWGMVQLARTIGMKELGQVVSGLTYSLGGYLAARQGFFSMIWVAAWLPWIIVAIEGLIDHNQSLKWVRRPWMRLVVFLSFMLLAGHAQLSWYIILLAGIWTAWRGWHVGGMGGIGKTVVNLGGAGVCAGLVASVQLIPTFEYLMQSQRSGMVDYEVAMAYSFWPWRFLTLLAPDLFGNPGYGDYWGYANYWEDAIYIGMLPLLLAMGATWSIFTLKRGDGLRSLLILLWGVIAVGLLFALGANTPVFPWLYRYVPTFDMFNAPSRYLIWVSFALSLLAGVGAWHWVRPQGRVLYWTRLATAGAVAVSIGAGLTWLSAGEEIRTTFIRATVIAGVWGVGSGILALTMPPHNLPQRRRVWQWLAAAWVCFDLVFAGMALNPGIEQGYFSGLPPDSSPAVVRNILDGQRLYLSASDEYHLKYDRFLTFDDFNLEEDWLNLREVLLPNLNLMEGIASANNFDPLVPGRYARWISNLDEMETESRQPWLALMNVGAVEEIDEAKINGVHFDPILGGKRFRWFGCVTWARDSEDAWQELIRLISESGSELPAVVVLEGGEILNDRAVKCNPGSAADITLISENPGEATINVNSPVDGWVMMADVWYPGWKVRVDNVVVESYRADYLFRAAAVPAGEHEISWEYKPASYLAGAVISILAVMMLVFVGKLKRV